MKNLIRIYDEQFSDSVSDAEFHYIKISNRLPGNPIREIFINWFHELVTTPRVTVST